MVRSVAVVVAAGRSERMGQGYNKVFAPLGGRPVLVHSLAIFEASPAVEAVVLVAREEDTGFCRELVRRYGLGKVTGVVSGGAERQDSVWNGLQEVPAGADVVVVHDGARPLATTGLLERVVEAAAVSGAAVPALPVRETLKRVSPDGAVAETVPREAVWAVQTPQAFSRSLLLAAFRRARADGFVATDDAALVERIGGRVTVVPGHYDNIKLTTPPDLELAAFFLNRRTGTGLTPATACGSAVGIGYDVHPLVEGRPLTLGGVRIPWERGLGGHSDADVVAHAVMDALLGAAGEGDIGLHFPDTDPQYEGISSLLLLERVTGLLQEKGWRVANVDLTVLAERPRIGPYAGEMRRRLAAAMGLAVTAMNVKATTSEGLGFVGREEGIAALAVAMIRGARSRSDDETETGG